ncbi:MAG: energy-coupling factor transporter transmembrane component T family protein [Candidatus Hodarchaeota archaeon]
MGLRFIESFDYTPQDTLIHALDPRTKITYALTVLTLSLLTTNLLPLLILFLVQLPLVWMARIGKKWKLTIQGLTLLVIIVVVLNVFLFQQSSTHPTSTGIAIAFRIYASFTVLNLLFLTVNPDDLSQAIQKLGAPYSFAWTLSTAYRFVPILGAEARTVKEAQLSRGLQIDKGNVLSRLKKTLPLLIPLFASALRRAQELAEAMEARAWNPKMKRTYFYEISMSHVDFVLTGICFLIFALAILFNWFLPITLPSWWTWTLPPQLELRYLLRSFIEVLHQLLRAIPLLYPP